MDYKINLEEGISIAERCKSGYPKVIPPDFRRQAKHFESVREPVALE
jgi:hypothetical protein